ncbi:MAG: hypothetical protein IPM69_14850 [Ignavibacteria bacterium]|nr:hypothetical protein [Ignavibacteria bacterium]
MTIHKIRTRQIKNKGLNGYCLYKDGQLIPPQEAVPTAQPLPQSVQEPYQQNTANTTDSNGQCCPQPNPISINITNSQDTNSRNTNTSRHVDRVPQQVVRPRQVRASHRSTIIRQMPIYRTLIQRVPYPVIQQVPIEVIKQVEVIKRVEVPVEVIKQVEIPVHRNTYTERIVQIPITGCEGKEFIYPSWT